MQISIVKISDLSEDEIKKISRFISERKRNKIKKFHKKEDKLRGIFSELLIRKMIIKELKIKNKDIIFEVDKYGKPFLKDREDIYINTSHSGEYVIGAVDNKPIGVDVEMIKKMEVNGIIEKLFTPREQDYILDNGKLITSSECIERFYEIWTLKESFVKCIGRGLSIPLNHFSIYFNEEREIEINTKVSENRFLFKEINLNKEYKISICSEGNIITNEYDYIFQDDLIKAFI